MNLKSSVGGGIRTILHSTEVAPIDIPLITGAVYYTWAIY